MIRELDKPEVELLREVFEKYAPKLLPRLSSPNINHFALNELEEVLEHLASEFQYSGLGEDWEPNNRGLDLDILIGIVNMEIIARKEANGAKGTPPE